MTRRGEATRVNVKASAPQRPDYHETASACHRRPRPARAWEVAQAKRGNTRDVTHFGRRAVSVVGVITFVLVSASATGPVDAAGHASAASPSAAQAGRCAAYRAYPGCHVYRVRIRASATTTRQVSSHSGSYDLVARVMVRYAGLGRRGYYPPTVALATGADRPKLLSFDGSGSYSDAVCLVQTKLRAGPIGWGVAGSPSRIHRSKTPRIVYYGLSISIGPTQGSPKPIPNPPPYDCPGEGGATTEFEKRLRSSDYHVAIGAHTSPSFTLVWYFHRPQRKGRMEFPLNLLTTGKRFELKLSGSDPYGGGSSSSKGTAHVVFEPVP